MYKVYNYGRVYTFPHTFQVAIFRGMAYKTTIYSVDLDLSGVELMIGR